MADLQGLIHNVPPVTRFFLISIVLVTGSVYRLSAIRRCVGES